jgi:hypothetical protein
MLVPVDVIRFAFWITVFIEFVYRGTMAVFSVLDSAPGRKFKIPMRGIQISDTEN